MKVIVVATHPDDETLGCGGTICKHKAHGDNVYWLIVTKLSEEVGFSRERIDKRSQEIEKVTHRYGFDGVFKLDYVTTRLDSVADGDLIGKIASVFNDVEPDIVYLPFCNDVHSDHRRVFDAAFACVKTFRYPSIKKVLMMEVVSETDFSPAVKEKVFIPNYFVDISPYMQEKADILKIYEGEMGEHPFPRSQKNLEALATYRGGQSGCEYAESFMLLKEIW